MSFILEKGTIFYQGKFQPLGRLVIEGSKITEVTLASGKAKKAKPPTGKHKGDNHEKIIDCEGKYILLTFWDRLLKARNVVHRSNTFGLCRQQKFKQIAVFLDNKQ